MDLDLAGLKLIHAQDMFFFMPWRIHHLPGSEGVVTVRSSIKALMELLDTRLGVRASALNFCCFDPHIHGKAKRITEMVHPGMIPFFRQF